jgi:hypothetical protein
MALLGRNIWPSSKHCNEKQESLSHFAGCQRNGRRLGKLIELCGKGYLVEGLIDENTTKSLLPAGLLLCKEFLAKDLNPDLLLSFLGLNPKEVDALREDGHRNLYAVLAFSYIFGSKVL